MLEELAGGSEAVRCTAMPNDEGNSLVSFVLRSRPFKLGKSIDTFGVW